MTHKRSCYHGPMFTALLITSRETLEAAIVIGIVLTFLAKTDQIFFRKYVWSGVGVGVSAAVLLALILELFFAGFRQFFQNRKHIAD